MCDVIEEAIPEEQLQSVRTRLSKRHWFPYLILAVLFAVGLVVYLCIPIKPQVLTDPQMPWFTICDGVLQYDPSLYTGEETLTVPSEIAGQSVTAIGGACFAGDDFITTINLPETVTLIGTSAFADCIALRGVFIPESVSEIGEKAFRGCIALESVCIPYSVKTIGKEAFGACPKLLHIFYTGPNSAWAALYIEPISPETKIYCANGIVKQEDIVASANNQAD